MARNVAVVVGSLRKQSFTRSIANALAEVAAPALRLEQVEIGSLPLYNADLETASPPDEWQRFRERVRPVDGVIFATPEYNRSVPGVLKNAIDVGSRPFGKSVWAGKPAGVISVSPGSIGGFGANHHRRQRLVFLDMPCMQQPEVYISGADKLLDRAGKLSSDAVRELLGKFAAAFARWIDRHAPAPAK